MKSTRLVWVHKDLSPHFNITKRSSLTIEISFQVSWEIQWEHHLQNAGCLKTLALLKMKIYFFLSHFDNNDGWLATLYNTYISLIHLSSVRRVGLLMWFTRNFHLLRRERSRVDKREAIRHQHEWNFICRVIKNSLRRRRLFSLLLLFLLLLLLTVDGWDVEWITSDTNLSLAFFFCARN